MNDFGPVSDDSVCAFETLIRAKLPTSFLNFLKSNNGGEIEDGFFKLSINTEDTDRVQLFYGLHSGPEYSRLDSCFKAFRGRVPEGFIPIGCDPFGNQICLSVSGDDVGSIWFWNHEDGLASNDGLLRLGADIDAFFKSIGRHSAPKQSEIDEAIETGNISAIKLMIENGLDVEALDDHQRNLLERAVIKNQAEIVEYLFTIGSSLRNAKAISAKNLKYFPEHQKTFDVIERLEKR